jgi:hypothetical protein
VQQLGTNSMFITVPGIAYLHEGPHSKPLGKVIEGFIITSLV